MTTELPGLKVEFSTDDGLTWNDVTAETEVNGDIKLRTKSDSAKDSCVLVLVIN